MTRSRIGVVLILTACACTAIALSMTVRAQRVRSPSPKSGPTAAELLPLTCAQAWAVSNRRYGEMVAIVKTLAHASLVNRDLTFPDTREAGMEAGQAIADDCRADPNALLFAVVDKQVKLIAGR